MGVEVGAAVVLAEGCDDAVESASGEDDGAPLGTAEGPHAATKIRTTARGRVLTVRSLATERVAWSDFAVAAAKRYEFRGGAPMPPRGVKSAKRQRQYEHIKYGRTAG